MALIYCRDCGTQISDSSVSCVKCGAMTRIKKREKDRITALILAFFLGGFGAHRFYLGQVGRGLLYLLFFWTLIPAIIAFVDLILFLFMSDKRFDEKYNM